MLKRIVTMVGVLVASLGWAETQNGNNQTGLEEDLEKEIQESCGWIADQEEFKICVKIVEMDFTIIPHNERQGGGQCPNGDCADSK